MQYVLKSASRCACMVMSQALRRHQIHAEVESLMEQPRSWGLAVAEDDITAAKQVIWGDPGRANIWDADAGQQVSAPRRTHGKKAPAAKGLAETDEPRGALG
jgi:hypothetical protein